MGQPFIVRRANANDTAGIAVVALATDQEAEGAGADPRYVNHLLNRGIVVVAVAENDDVVGYAASLLVDDVDMLTDLFVAPSRHGEGLGQALLDEVWSDSSERMTLSSAHPSALPLYIRYGMSPWFPMLYVSGEPTGLPDGCTVRVVTGEVAAQAELSLTGVDRKTDYEYWAVRPNARCFIVEQHESTAAVGAVGGEGISYSVSHLSIAPSVNAAAAAEAAAAQLTRKGYVCVPGPNPALPALLDRSWRIIDLDHFMSTRPDVIDPLRLLPHSGLM